MRHIRTDLCIKAKLFPISWNVMNRYRKSWKFMNIGQQFHDGSKSKEYGGTVKNNYAICK